MGVADYLGQIVHGLYLVFWREVYGLQRARAHDGRGCRWRARHGGRDGGDGDGDARLLGGGLVLANVVGLAQGCRAGHDGGGA